MPDKQDTKAAPENLDEIKTEVFNKVTGPRGPKALLFAARQKLVKLEDDKIRTKNTMVFIEGQISIMKETITSLELLVEQCGITNIETRAVGEAENPVATQERVVMDKEFEAHVAKGKCKFVHFEQTKDGRKRKFCQRKGVKKCQGFCKIHWDRVQGGKAN